MTDAQAKLQVMSVLKRSPEARVRERYIYSSARIEVMRVRYERWSFINFARRLIGLRPRSMVLIQLHGMVYGAGVIGWGWSEASAWKCAYQALKPDGFFGGSVGLYD